ncbi:unnamed protein product [Owenia fusiformis]|uniref:Uncharacterized protein n=1 Tax=Owenia fusiformis TaxID=6347 RepID=A0A8J1Y843_OWEFU|nr:unnamed protein product [Owenia fusiformis]
MSFKESDGAASMPQFKKFETEGEIAEKKKKRQEEWEKVRKPEEPMEAPEEKFDPRCLYDQLEANKLAKQEEYDEAHKLKNMVRGLESDEVEFLDFVSQKQEEIEERREREEKRLLQEYKEAMVTKVTDTTKVSTEKKVARPQMGTEKKETQKKLLAGAVKRKTEPDSSSNLDSKKQRTTSSDSTNPETATSDSTVTQTNSSVTSQNSTVTSSNGGMAKVIGVLPGLGAYSQSSDSDSSDSEDDIDTDTFAKKKKTPVYV